MRTNLSAKYMKEKYEQTIAYLFEMLPMFQRIGPMAFKKDLTNILALSESIGNPHLSFPTIHIAGTNGKGSTAHMMSAVLQAKGLKVGLYTSPHYRDFRERIKINGQFISEEEVISFVENHKHLFEKIEPSFFEITVAMAFLYFKREKVDIAVIETGLGGRLDSTNIITPILSVITNISFDHEQFLGNTLPLIASEKAGIIKENIPVVIGEYHTETAPVFLEKAKEKNAPIVFADQHFKVELKKGEINSSTYAVFRDGNLILNNLETELTGEYQYLNIQTVLQSLECLPKQWIPSEQELRYGLANLKKLTTFFGRWQVIQEHPLVLCDSAHNHAGIEKVVSQLDRIPYRNLLFVLGMVKDKDISKILALLPKYARYFFTKPDVPRGLDEQLLQEKAAAFGLTGETYSTVAEALEAAKLQAGPNDLIFVGGSTFVVAEIV